MGRARGALGRGPLGWGVGGGALSVGECFLCGRL